MKNILDTSSWFVKYEREREREREWGGGVIFYKLAIFNAKRLHVQGTREV